jgi:SAM-dependent methyltransferase/uncharacterized protein YbaR (Trm112 family)
MKPDVLSWLCCPVDHSGDLRFEATKTIGREIVTGSIRCNHCSAVYAISNGIPHLMSLQNLAPVALGSRMRELAARDNDSNQYDESLSRSHNAIELSAIVSALRPMRGDTVVDLGAGTGRLTLPLARGGAQVVAIDLSPRSLEINRQKCEQAGVGDRVVHVMADACHLPIRTSTIEKLGGGMLLEHITPAQERRRCVEEIHRVLRPGCRMAITAYNYSWSLRRRRAPREGSHNGDLYFYRFEGRELASLFAAFRKPRVSGILNLPKRLSVPALDRVVRALPPLAVLSAELLFAEAYR